MEFRWCLDTCQKVARKYPRCSGGAGAKSSAELLASPEGSLSASGGSCGHYTSIPGLLVRDVDDLAIFVGKLANFGHGVNQPCSGAVDQILTRRIQKAA